MDINREVQRDVPTQSKGYSKQILNRSSYIGLALSHKQNKYNELLFKCSCPSLRIIVKPRSSDSQD